MLIFSQWLSFGWQAEMVDANIFIGQQHGCCVSTRANSRRLSSFSVRIEGVTDPSPFLRTCWLRLEEGAGANYPKGSYENINNCVCLPDQPVLRPTQTFWFQEVQSEGGEGLIRCVEVTRRCVDCALIVEERRSRLGQSLLFMWVFQDQKKTDNWNNTVFEQQIASKNPWIQLSWKILSTGYMYLSTKSWSHSQVLLLPLMSHTINLHRCRNVCFLLKKYSANVIKYTTTKMDPPSYTGPFAW